LRAHADDSTTEGWGVGDRYKNVSASDQFGQQVDLYQFYGNVVLLDFSAGWCAPCRAVAKTAEAEYRERADDGFVIVHMMFEDYSGNLPTKGFLQTWAAASRLTFPVIYDPSVEDNLDGLYESGLYKGSIPFMILLDRDMTIVQAVKGSNQVDDLLSTADELLAR
ncbi:MAG: peroxiredoxin, partial [Kiritimatiellia bacterium]